MVGRGAQGIAGLGRSCKVLLLAWSGAWQDGVDLSLCA